MFMVVLAFLFGAAYVGGALGISSTWTVVFGIGASASATYLVMAPLALSERIRSKILFAKMGRRAVLLAAVYGPILAGISYWIYLAGSVEALPILPYFIGIFYAWILSQAYFIANPITQVMSKFENKLEGKGLFKKIARTLGVTVLFLPIAPLGFGVWEISAWARQNYASINGADTYILAWTLIVSLLLVATYSVVVKWGWKNIKSGKPQAAVFAGGTFVIVWGYLLYRAATTLIAAVTQNQPSLPAIDIGLMVISILGAMQTFARKTVNMADRRWSQALPFLVFSFGSVYAVSQYYFILQGGLSRAAVSAIVNGMVFAVGTLTLMLLLRHHLRVPTSSLPTGENRTAELVVPSHQPEQVQSSPESDQVSSQSSDTNQESDQDPSNTNAADSQSSSDDQPNSST
ncbi:MAG TPA: hypothetical protein VFJ63_02030 [Candidatus Bathyarchaeia archaeon]|nr:hypothetical protein [Candidatus Bathyarchaeia archaeon]